MKDKFCVKVTNYYSTYTYLGDLFFEATAVLMAEVVKLLTCLYLVFRDENRSVAQWSDTLHRQIVVNKWDTFKVCIPSAIYLVQVCLRGHDLCRHQRICR